MNSSDNYAGVFIKKGEKVLLVQEVQPQAFGQWSLPAGKVEDYETNEEAAIREAKEETGYTVKISKKLNTYEYHQPDYHYHVFEAEVIDGNLTINPLEHLNAGWFTPEEIRLLELRPSNQFILDLIQVQAI